MSDDNKITRFVESLNRHGIKYIYDDIANEFGCSWINVNTNHMNNLFEFYDNCLKGYNYSISIEINEELKYISKEYKSIIEYFKDNAEFKKPNKIYKIVHFKYYIDVP